MTIFAIFLTILAAICLFISLFEGKNWQKIINVSALFGIGFYWFKMSALTPKQIIFYAVAILVVAVVWSIYNAVTNATPPADSLKEDAESTKSNTPSKQENRSRSISAKA